MDNLNSRNIGRLLIPVPPVEKQRPTVEKCAETYRLTIGIKASTGAAINRLREYRYALITAAVTGQLDIRDHEKKMEALS